MRIWWCWCFIHRGETTEDNKESTHKLTDEHHPLQDISYSSERESSKNKSSVCHISYANDKKCLIVSIQNNSYQSGDTDYWFKCSANYTISKNAANCLYLNICH